MNTPHRAQPKFQRQRPRRIVMGCIIGLTMSLLAAALNLSPPLQQFERNTLDLRFRMRGPRASTTRVVVVNVDDESLNRYTLPLYKWGGYWGQAVTTLNKMGARGIGFDLVQSADAEQTRQLLLAILGANGKVVLPGFVAHDATGKEVVRHQLEALDTAANYAAQEARLPDAIGFINLEEDADGVIREHRPVLPVRNSDADQSGASPTLSLVLAERSNPAVRQDAIIINYIGPAGTVTHIPFWKILQPGREASALQSQIAGALVVIGFTDAGFNDFKSTPYGRMEGAEIHANIIATMLENNPIHPGNPMRVLLGLLVAGTALGGLITMLQRPIWAACATLVFLGLWEYGAWWAFEHLNRWLPMVAPLVTMSLAFAAVTLWRIIVSESEVASLGQEVDLLGQYVGPTVQGVLREDPRALEAEGRECNITVLFTDIRDFTIWSQHKSPTEVVRLINRIGSILTPLVFAHNGTVDKFLGDGMMAFFGAPLADPNHPKQAVRCALAIQDALNRDAELAVLFPGLRVGIGLHSGPAVVGFLQAEEKKEYTALGDTVNLASRMEEAAKHFGAEIVMSEATFRAASQKPDPVVIGEDYCFDEPCEYTPYNHNPVTVCIVRRKPVQQEVTGGR